MEVVNQALFSVLVLIWQVGKQRAPSHAVGDSTTPVVVSILDPSTLSLVLVDVLLLSMDYRYSQRGWVSARNLFSHRSENGLSRVLSCLT
jgi:hypothetical protein